MAMGAEAKPAFDPGLVSLVLIDLWWTRKVMN